MALRTRTRTRTLTLTPLTRAQGRTTTYNAKERTMLFVATTGERVLRRDYRICETPFWEELGLEADEVDLSRLNSGRSNLIDNHGDSNGAGWGQEFQTDNGLGVILAGSAVVKDYEGRRSLLVNVRFATGDEKLEAKVKNIADGTFAQASLGYTVSKYRLIETGADGYPVFRAVRWQPFELSTTLAAAETHAGARNAPPENPCSIEAPAAGQQGRTKMALRTRKPARGSKPAKPAAGEDDDDDPTRNASEDGADDEPEEEPAVDEPEDDDDPADQQRAIDAARAEGAKAERKRAGEIRTMVTRAKLPPEFAEELIGNDKLSIAGARKKVFERLTADGSDDAPDADGNPPAPAPATPRVTAGRQLENEAIQLAMVCRELPELYTLDKITDATQREAVRSFMGYSFLDFARHYLEREGVRVRGMDRLEIAERALMRTSREPLRYRSLHATSDFPEILANTAGKVMRDKYSLQPNTWQAWCKPGTLRDFKVGKRIQIGGVGALREIPEGGVTPSGTFGEEAEPIQLASYGLKLAISRQAIVNDDMEVFTQVPSLFALSASLTLENLAYLVLTASNNMADGNPFIDTTIGGPHGNYTEGATMIVDETGLSALRELINNQTTIGGDQLNYDPGILLVSTKKRTLAEKLVSAVQATKTGDVNIFAGKLRVVANARLNALNSGLSFFALVDPQQLAAAEMAFLEGQPGPRIESRAGWDVQGIEIQCLLDATCKAIEWRAVAKSKGSA